VKAAIVWKVYHEDMSLAIVRRFKNANDRSTGAVVDQAGFGPQLGKSATLIAYSDQSSSS